MEREKALQEEKERKKKEKEEALKQEEERKRKEKEEALNDWYVIEQVNIDGIVMWQDASGAVYQTAPNTKAKKICKSLAEYINL